MSRYRDNCPADCKVYVGDLGNSGTKHELEDAFGYYGPLRNVWVARNPPGFAFIEFEDPRDARDSVRALDGKVLCSRRVRVELSTGRSRSSFRGPPPRPFHPDDRCYDCGERGHYARDCKRVSKRSYRSRSRSRNHRSRSRSRNRSASRSRSRSKSASRSPSRSRSRSASRSPSRSRSKSGSRGHSPKKNASKSQDRASPARSASRSPDGYKSPQENATRNGSAE